MELEYWSIGDWFLLDYHIVVILRGRSQRKRFIYAGLSGRKLIRLIIGISCERSRVTGSRSGQNRSRRGFEARRPNVSE